jgi:gamma-glutamylcyclotransferase (GGCT)/AIG2-like uncharacterized protein YtfP
LPLPLFCYGTLELPAVMQAVSGQLPGREPAALHGYRRGLILGRDYPGIEPADDCVSGTLYRSPGPGALQRIDRFEGSEYTRQRVTVRTARGNIRAWAYLPRPGRARVGHLDWDPRRFERRELARYLRRL